MKPDPSSREQADPPSITVFGGGTGLNSLLRGLKKYTEKLTAIVAVTDDGGSSGRLRSDLGMPPPGDIRNCLAALAEEESLATELFEYRFTDSDMAGHPFGNLFIAALTQITGDFSKAVKLAHRILSVRGRVLPATHDRVALEAEHDDGTKTTGEYRISQSTRRIRRVSLRPKPGKVPRDVKDAVAAADILVFGPGSLYTSVLPPLLNEGMVDCVLQSNAAKMYVCNVMTQPGETDGFKASEHVEAVLEHTSRDLFDTVIVNTAAPPEKLLERYAEMAAYPVVPDVETIERKGKRIIAANVISTDDYVRHDSEELARVIVNSRIA